MRLPTLPIAALSLLAVLAPAHAEPAPQAHASRTSQAVHLDGHLDEAAWAAAAPTTVFTQIDPEEGKPATQATEVRVLYDDAYLYIGARLHDTGPTRARLGRRDMDPGDSDWFRVFLDSYHDHRTAFGFEVNPAGVRRDEIRTIDADDNTWDPVWDVATSVEADGWSAEMRIPFSQLRYSGAREQTWGVQFERVTGRTNEDALSTFIPKSERGGVPLYGELLGLADLKPGSRLEVLPYGLVRSSYVDGGINPFKGYPENEAEAGSDLLYRVTSNLTLNAAINPDFGQVEVDPAVVNLGVYETFFQEKRPFFIEGTEIFDFGADGTSGGQVFYTRRIGRAPSLFLPPGRSDQPQVTRILGAGKLSGKVGAWSLGILEAVTQKEEGRLQTSATTDTTLTLEPLSNYFVGRARGEWRGGQTIVGGIFTATNRSPDDARVLALHSAAYTGGVDFHHEWGNHMWSVYGDGELSRIEGSAPSITLTELRSNHFFQRPDATHLDLDTDATSLDGYSVNLQMRKQGGRHWRARLGTAFTSPGYEVNDLGFSFRTDRRDFETDLTYVENKPGALLRNWNVTATQRLERNFDWQPILTFTEVTANATTPQYWTLNAIGTRYYRSFDDRLTRGGPLARRPAWWQGYASLRTDGRKSLTGNLTLTGDDYESGSWDGSVALGLGVKTSSRWNLTVTPTFTRLHSEAQYVTTIANPANAATYGADYLFAPLDQTSFALETRLNVTFTPHLSFETYVQPLLSAQNYGDLRQLVYPGTYDFSPSALGSADFLDFNFRSLRGNAVLRWEWREGSTLFLAWQQSRQDEVGIGDFSFARDRAALFRTRPDDVFLVKVTYWLSV